jgi:hypothetical protein
VMRARYVGSDYPQLEGLHCRVQRAFRRTDLVDAYPSVSYHRPGGNFLAPCGDFILVRGEHEDATELAMARYRERSRAPDLRGPSYCSTCETVGVHHRGPCDEEGTLSRRDEEQDWITRRCMAALHGQPDYGEEDVTGDGDVGC